jgi:succinate dehydrogenase / fumarate reductase, cytochrome b subunit
MANEASRSAPRVRPQFRNIHVSQIMHYRLPLAGIISILHRVSGAAMFFFGIPFVLYLFSLSLTSELSWIELQRIGGFWWVKLITLGFIWSFCHHICCGFRYLMLDMHKGLEKGQAKNSAVVVMGVSLLMTAFFAYKLFLG